MNTFSPASTPGMDFLALIVGLIGFAITVIWIVIAWRAMRAHEQLAESHASIARSIDKNPGVVSTSRKDITAIDPSTLPKFTD